MNDMTFSQCSTVLKNIVEQATGQKVITAITTPADFVAVAQTALKTGYDPVINAVSQLMSRTIFSYRDYHAPNSGLEMSLERYGNMIRKLSPVAGDMEDDKAFTYPVAYDATKTPATGNGESVDMWKINKQETLQTNFYGTAVYQQRFTIFKDQFDSAFRDATEFGRYMSMNMTERNNDRESYKASVARGLQANFIGGILAEGNTSRVIHLLTEYNAQTGLSLTAQTVYKPENFAAFIRWVYARIAVLAKMFAERSEMYQTVVNGKTILRHTPASDIRIALYNPVMEQIRTMVLSTTYHDDKLKLANWDGVTYWQSIETPDSISVTPVYTGTDGTVKTGSATEQAGIFGIIHDVNAMGYAFTNTWSAVTPLNIDGGYWNEAYHATVKTISDNTEKAVVLLLD